MVEGVTAALGLGRIDHGWIGVDDPDVLRRLRAARTPMAFAPTAYSLGALVSRTGCVDYAFMANALRCRTDNWAPPRSVR